MSKMKHSCMVFLVFVSLHVLLAQETTRHDAFAYSKIESVKLIVGVPDDELLPYIDKKVKEYDFRFVVHNHGPGDPRYPNAKSIWNKVKDFDPRIGMCLDIGHNVRTGADLVAGLKKYHKRVFDIHIKDVTAAAKEGTDIEMGCGIIDIPCPILVLRDLLGQARNNTDQTYNDTGAKTSFIPYLINKTISVAQVNTITNQLHCLIKTRKYEVMRYGQ